MDTLIWFVYGFLFMLGGGLAILMLPVRKDDKHKELVFLLKDKNHFLRDIAESLEELKNLYERNTKS